MRSMKDKKDRVNGWSLIFLFELQAELVQSAPIVMEHDAGIAEVMIIFLS